MKVGEGDKRQGWEGSLGGGGEEGEVEEERLECGSWLQRRGNRLGEREERKARAVPEQERLLDAQGECVTRAPGVLRLPELGSPSLGDSRSLEVPKAPPISQTFPKTHFPAFFPRLIFPGHAL